ncbi:MAG: Uma2 family endonuclease, partial [Chloroflexota bacterium]
RVQEYLVLLAYEQETRWLQLVEGEYILLSPDKQGVIRSQIFPGLHFHPDLFWADDLSGLLAVLQDGLNSPEHQAFQDQLTV